MFKPIIPERYFPLKKPLNYSEDLLLSKSLGTNLPMAVRKRPGWCFPSLYSRVDGTGCGTVCVRNRE